MDRNTIPKPCEHDSGCFAQAGRDVDELRMAIRARIAPRQTGLVIVWLIARGGLEKFGKCHSLKFVGIIVPRPHDLGHVGASVCGDEGPPLPRQAGRAALLSAHRPRPPLPRQAGRTALLWSGLPSSALAVIISE